MIPAVDHEMRKGAGADMIWTIDEALAHELINVISLERKIGIVKFRVGIAPTVITARIIRKSSAKYVLEVSHTIKTPSQPNSYLPAFRDCASRGAALRELVVAFTHEYENATTAGYQPCKRWFVSNKYYNPDGVELLGRRRCERASPFA